MPRILIEKGDITDCKVDAIVNAANNQLILGAGVAGAIARRGGPTIQQECSQHGPVKVGEAAITTAGKLPARYVIHAASMSLGSRTTEESLANSVRASLRLAEENDVKTIAFPAIGTGVAGFPLEKCADIMLREVVCHLEGASGLQEIHFVLFDEHARQVFTDRYEKMGKPY